MSLLFNHSEAIKEEHIRLALEEKYPNGLYIGHGSKKIEFFSKDSSQPERFW